jgi:8-oxo-dGTP pyrophosphatase MutT (NUDIX family)
MNMKSNIALRDDAEPVGGAASAPEKGQQVAALCYRDARDGKEVLLITSRDTGRWIIPKGWPMRGKTDAQAAAIEAWEEAGVKSANVECDPIGSYEYDKMQDDGVALPVETQVYSVEVDRLAKMFPEVSERDRAWVSPNEAADMVDEPELKALLNSL